MDMYMINYSSNLSFNYIQADFNISVDTTIDKLKIQYTIFGTGFVMKDHTLNPLRKRVADRRLPIPWFGPFSILKWLIYYPLDALIDFIIDLYVYGFNGPECEDR